LTESFERGAHSLQSAANRFRRCAEPNAEVLGLFEEISWHYACVELVA
jgi:hypothetical protein